MDELVKLVSQERPIQPFAARQKNRQHKGVLVSLFSLVNRLVFMTTLVILLRWWLQRQNEEQPQEQPSREKEISLDRYERGSWMEQPQTAPVQAPAASGFEATWPEPEASLSQAEAAPVKDLAEPEMSAGTQMDDLRLVEGIGPKISSVLQSAGIRTFQQLADTQPGRIEEILQESGLRLANPATWPEQAKLLADGDLEGLRQLQAQLKAGRRSQTNEK